MTTTMEGTNMTNHQPVREAILCAAIWYKQLPTSEFQPYNINEGLVVCGWRHGNCINTVKLLSNLRTVTLSPDGVGEHEQGFLTNKNRFVNRQEGWKIAEAAGQINNRVRGSDGTLYSEDLY